MHRGTPVRLVLALTISALPLLVAAVSPAVLAAAPLHGTPRVLGRQVTSSVGLPAGLAPVVERTLRGEEEARYAVRQDSRGYRATNPAQGIQIEFAAGGPQLSGPGRGHGSSWMVGLSLTGYGRERLQPLDTGRRVAHGASLEYQRDGLTEWYDNSAQGLEQGFTLQQRPAGAVGQPVRLALRVTGNLRARLVSGGQTVAFGGVQGAAMLSYGGLRTVDARGRLLPSHLALTRGTRMGVALWLMVDDRGARYPLRIDPVAQHQQITSSDANANDQFGSAIRLSTDGNTALIGALGANTSTGAVYAFIRSGTSWTEQQKLTAKGGVSNDNFGGSLALSDDGNTVIIGASGVHNSTGAAYVFTRKGTTWTQQQKLTASDGAANDTFGGVALSGDGNTAMVGASTKNNFTGAAYVFTRTGTVWKQVQKLLPSDVTHDFQFGTSAALSNDGSIAIIGQDNKVTQTGAGYVFTRKGTTWIQQQKLIAPDATTNDNFGGGVALSSDGNTALVGAPSKNNSIGSVRVFARKGTAWSSVQELTPNDGEANDNFGILATLSSDGNTALIGAYNKVNNTGAAYLFTHSGTTWKQEQEVTGSDSQPGDTFGYTGAVTNGGGTVLISGVGHNSYQGTVYYFAPGGAIAPVKTGPKPTPFSGALSGVGSGAGSTPSPVAAPPSNSSGTTSQGPDATVFAIIGVVVLVVLGLVARIVLAARRRGQ